MPLVKQNNNKKHTRTMPSSSKSSLADEFEASLNKDSNRKGRYFGARISAKNTTLSNDILDVAKLSKIVSSRSDIDDIANEIKTIVKKMELTRARIISSIKEMSRVDASLKLIECLDLMSKIDNSILLGIQREIGEIDDSFKGASEITDVRCLLEEFIYLKNKCKEKAKTNSKIESTYNEMLSLELNNLRKIAHLKQDSRAIMTLLVLKEVRAIVPDVISEVEDVLEKSLRGL